MKESLGFTAASGVVLDVKVGMKLGFLYYIIFRTPPPRFWGGGIKDLGIAWWEETLRPNFRPAKVSWLAANPLYAFPSTCRYEEKEKKKMSSDEIVWQVINQQFCSFKLKYVLPVFFSGLQGENRLGMAD